MELALALMKENQSAIKWYTKIKVGKNRERNEESVTCHLCKKHHTNVAPGIAASQGIVLSYKDDKTWMYDFQRLVMTCRLTVSCSEFLSLA